MDLLRCGISLRLMSPSGSKTEVTLLPWQVRSTLRSRRRQTTRACPKSANSGSPAPGRNTAPRPSDQRKLNRNSQDSCHSAYPCGLVHYPHALRQPSFHVARSAIARNTITEWAGTGRNGHCSSNRMLGTTQSAKAVLHRASRPSESAHRCARRHHKGHGESLVRKSPVLGH